jgi:hypothetical protein
MTHRETKRAYSSFLVAVVRLLYDFDPDGIGRSIDAPLDEYSEEATRLVARLSRSETADEAAVEVRNLFPTAELPLIDALWGARQRFKEETSQ